MDRAFAHAMDMGLKIRLRKAGFLVSFLVSCLLMQWQASQATTSQKSIRVRPRVALALGGDGLRSAACVGILKVLDEEGIPVDIVVGSGMGAVVGGLYSAGVTPQHIEQEFTDKKLMNAYLTVPLSLRLLASPIIYAPRLIGFKPYDGLYRGKTFAAYLNKQVPATERNIEDLKIPFGAVAVDLLDGQCKTISHGNLGKALQASAAIPALRKPVKLDDGGLYVAGGVLVNIPVKAARKMGGDIVIAVDLDEAIKPAVDDDFRQIGSVSHRVVALHMNKIDASELKDADFIIKPEIGCVGLISTKQSDAANCIEAGERAAKRSIPAIRELLESKYAN